MTERKTLRQRAKTWQMAQEMKGYREQRKDHRRSDLAEHIEEAVGERGGPSTQLIDAGQEPPPPGRALTEVFVEVHGHRSAGLHGPDQLAQPLRRRGEVVEHAVGIDEVKAIILKREPADVRLDDVGGRQRTAALKAGLAPTLAELDANDLRPLAPGVTGHITPGAASGIKEQAARGIERQALGQALEMGGPPRGSLHRGRCPPPEIPETRRRPLCGTGGRLSTTRALRNPVMDRIRLPTPRTSQGPRHHLEVKMRRIL